MCVLGAQKYPQHMFWLRNIQSKVPRIIYHISHEEFLIKFCRILLQFLPKYLFAGGLKCETIKYCKCSKI